MQSRPATDLAPPGWLRGDSAFRFGPRPGPSQPPRSILGDPGPETPVQRLPPPKPPQMRRSLGAAAPNRGVWEGTRERAIWEAAAPQL